MSDAFNDSKPRNAQAMAAWQRKAGPHSGRHADVFDRINEYDEEQFEELHARQNHRTFDVTARVRVTLPGPFLDEEGTIVSREMNRDGFFVWGVAFDHGGLPVSFMTNELEVV